MLFADWFLYITFCVIPVPGFIAMGVFVRLMWREFHTPYTEED